MQHKPFHLGVCTSGGDCPGLNAVIRAVVKHAIGTCNMQVTGIRTGLSGIMAETPEAMPLSLTEVSDLQSRGGTILGTSNKGSPFRRPGEFQNTLDAARRGWAKIGLDGLIVIGGDGTQLMARHLHDLGLKLIGIPKTIDNDVWGSDRSIGFSSAVDVAVEAADRLKTSADAHDRIMILEVMGRHSGHIALETAIAGGANAVLIPEIPFDFDEVAMRIKARSQLGRSSYLIIVAEGAYPKDSQPVWKLAPTGASLLGGIGEIVGHELHRRTSIDARVTVLGHLQRGGAPNATDKMLGAMLGKKAVDLAASGRWGVIVGTHRQEFIELPYADVSDRRRKVELTSDVLRTAEALGTSLGRPSMYRGLI